MFQIIPQKPDKLVAITENYIYWVNVSVDYLKPQKGVKERNEFDKFFVKYGLTFADMPLAIRILTNYPRALYSFGREQFDTTTVECHGLRCGEPYYEIWHSIGSLTSGKGLEKALSRVRNRGFTPIADDEWAEVGKGSYQGRDIPRIHLSDLKKGDVPATGIPFVAFVRLNKDRFNIYENMHAKLIQANNKVPKYDLNRGLIYSALRESEFIQDDRILMVAGSPENRDALAEIILKIQKIKGSQKIQRYHAFLYNNHSIGAVGFDAKAKGRLVSLYGDGLDFCCGNEINQRNFIGVREVRAGAVVHPTLDEILAIIKNPSLDKEGEARAVSQLYKYNQTNLPHSIL